MHSGVSESQSVQIQALTTKMRVSMQELGCSRGLYICRLVALLLSVFATVLLLVLPSGLTRPSGLYAKYVGLQQNR